MPLFQQSVIKKHLESFDKNHIEERWQVFRGIVSKIQAAKKAINEYDEFNKTQKIISDFDKHIKKLNS